MTESNLRKVLPTKYVSSKFAAPMVVIAMLAVGGTILATGNAEARTCVELFDGLELCLDDSEIVTPDTDDDEPEDEYVQTIKLTTKSGSKEQLVQSFRRSTVREGLTRICLVNQKGGRRSLRHGVSGINPLQAEPGGSSCANFASKLRVTFVPYTNSNPAKPSKPLVYSLSRYDGGMLTLRWQ